MSIIGGETTHPLEIWEGLTDLPLADKLREGVCKNKLEVKRFEFYSGVLPCTQTGIIV